MERDPIADLQYDLFCFVLFFCALTKFTPEKTLQGQTKRQNPSGMIIFVTNPRWEQLRLSTKTTTFQGMGVECRALRKSICFDNIFNHRKNNCSVIRTTKDAATIK